MWKAGIALAGMLLLVLMVWVPVSAAGAYEGTSGLAMPVTETVQATPTVDPTMAALQKEQLTLQNDKLKNDNAWAWLSPVSTILGPLATVGTILVGILIARNNLLQWSKNREDEQKNRADDQRIEREKRDEERFQSVVEGLGSERMEAKVGAAITLRTFLQPGYERFYRQAFDLAVAHLRLRPVDPNTPAPPDLDTPTPPEPSEAVSLDPLSQALITVFKESFPRARKTLMDQEKSQFDPQSLDASRIRLDNAYLVESDLKGIWMREAFLIKADLRRADLSEARLTKACFGRANLRETNLCRAYLYEADLRGAYFRGAILRGATLRKADLNGAHLRGADFTEADFTEADLNGAHLRGADLRTVKGLPKEQLEACKAKGAIIDEDTTTSQPQSSVSPSPPSQSKDKQAPSAPFVQ